MTYSERWRLQVVKWRLAGLLDHHIEARRVRYRIAKREGWADRLLTHWATTKEIHP